MALIVSEDNVARLGRHSGKLPAKMKNMRAAGEHLFSNTHLEEAVKIQWASKEKKKILSIRQTNWIISASGRMEMRPVWRICSRFRGNSPSPRLWWRCSVGGALTGSAGVHLSFFFFFFFYIRTPTTVCPLQGESFSLCNITNRQQGYFQGRCSIFRYIIFYFCATDRQSYVNLPDRRH